LAGGREIPEEEVKRQQKVRGINHMDSKGRRGDQGRPRNPEGSLKGGDRKEVKTPQRRKLRKD